jgi:hypothetical protein
MTIPNRFIFMKVGNHAGEGWEDILTRKRKEIEKAGVSFWGYGGTTCHPINHVQPFARLSIRQQNGIFLVMQPINSNAQPDIVPARQYSADGIIWQPIPKDILVTGSRYALVLDEILPSDLELDLRSFEVGIGPSEGRPAEQYLRARIDKACLAKSNQSRLSVSTTGGRKIGYVAKLKEPYAVLLRG